MECPQCKKTIDRLIYEHKIVETGVYPLPNKSFDYLEQNQNILEETLYCPKCSTVLESDGLTINIP